MFARYRIDISFSTVYVLLHRHMYINVYVYNFVQATCTLAVEHHESNPKVVLSIPMFWGSPLEDSAPVCGMGSPPEFSGVIGEFQFREYIYLVYLREASYGYCDKT
jgi:hypothetical protein